MQWSLCISDTTSTLPLGKKRPALLNTGLTTINPAPQRSRHCERCPQTAIALCLDSVKMPRSTLNVYSCFQNSMEVPEKLKNEPPCDPAIPLLGNGIIRWKRESRLPGVCSAVRDNQDFGNPSVYRHPRTEQTRNTHTVGGCQSKKGDPDICSTDGPGGHSANLSQTEARTAWSHVCVASLTNKMKEQLCGGQMWGVG